jgi:hypothetical protein
MSPVTYQLAAARTLHDAPTLYATLGGALATDPRTIPLLMAAVGLAGECAEWATGGHDPAEAGDVLWYVACIAHWYGFDLSAVASANVEKLRKRYPDGFSVEASRNRGDE